MQECIYTEGHIVRPKMFALKNEITFDLKNNMPYIYL